MAVLGTKYLNKLPNVIKTVKENNKTIMNEL